MNMENKASICTSVEKMSVSYDVQVFSNLQGILGTDGLRNLKQYLTT